MKNTSLIPWAPPDPEQGVYSAEVEAALSSSTIRAIQMKHLNMIASAFIWLGVLYWASRFMVQPITIENLQGRSYVELIGLVIFLYMIWLAFKYLAQSFINVSVDTMAFNSSVSPYTRVGNIFFTPSARVYMALMSLLFNGVYFILWAGGISGWFIALVSEKINVEAVDATTRNFIVVLFVCLLIAQWAGFLWYPASKARPIDAIEIAEGLMWKRELKIFKLQLKFIEDVVRIATPHLAVELVRDIHTRGPAAFNDWIQIPVRDNLGMSERLGVGYRSLVDLRYALNNGDHVISVTDKQGKRSVGMIPSVPDRWQQYLPQPTQSTPQPANPVPPVSSS